MQFLSSRLASTAMMPIRNTVRGLLGHSRTRLALVPQSRNYWNASRYAEVAVLYDNVPPCLQGKSNGIFGQGFTNFSCDCTTVANVRRFKEAWSLIHSLPLFFSPIATVVHLTEPNPELGEIRLKRKMVPIDANPAGNVHGGNLMPKKLRDLAIFFPCVYLFLFNLGLLNIHQVPF